MQVFSTLPRMLDAIFDHLDQDGIDVSGFLLDHVCYRVGTFEEYSQMKEIFAGYGEILKEEKMIAGRPIATYKLHEPIIYHEREIPCVEIPAPKEGSHYPSGWEHAEFVIKGTLEDFMSRYPDIGWKTESIHKAINPEIAKVYGNFSVKFHTHDLEYVIMELE